MSETTKDEIHIAAEGNEKPDQSVQSANNWESVDLGDDERRKKFLRLMGAGKKEHHGKIVIGDHDPVHCRSKTDNMNVEEKLEEQFQQSLEHKLTGAARAHSGFGFHEQKEEHEDEQKDGETEKVKTAEEETKENKGEGDVRKGEKRPTDEKDELESKKIKFVMSSS